MNEPVPDQSQSTVGKVSSGYLKVGGYGNLIGSIIAFILGGLFILLGLVLALLFRSFFLLLLAALGVLLVFFGFLGLKWSKKMREGKYYHVGKGWVQPQ